MDDFVKDFSYEYKAIQGFAEGKGLNLVEHGSEIIGRNFLVLIDWENDKTCSFVLDGATANGFIYKCIYKD